MRIDGIGDVQIGARCDRRINSNALMTVSIREGKNRVIRLSMEHLGHRVRRLIRVSYGPFQLGDLGDGEVEEIRPRIIADQLGISLPAGPNDDRPTLTAGKRGQHANHSQKPPRHKINKTRRR